MARPIQVLVLTVLLALGPASAMHSAALMAPAIAATHDIGSDACDGCAGRTMDADLCGATCVAAGQVAALAVDDIAPGVLRDGRRQLAQRELLGHAPPPEADPPRGLSSH